MSRAMPLHDLLRDDVATLPAFNPLVSGLNADSRTLRAGEAFVALRGASTHGLNFAANAESAGVAAILFEAPAPDGIKLPNNAVMVPDLRGKLGGLADRFYDAPSKRLAMTGVTGTNGKTSTVQLIAQALTLHGDRAGTIGTLGAGLYGELVAGVRTTPDVIAVHRLLAQMRDAGATHVAMEVSSHALEQGRVDAVAFKVAVFTNLTRDHLDYHGTMDAYGAAKAKLFTWPTLEAVVINLDDGFGIELIAQVADGVKRIGVSSRGHAGAALAAENPTLTPGRSAFSTWSSPAALCRRLTVAGSFQYRQSACGRGHLARARLDAHGDRRNAAAAVAGRWPHEPRRRRRSRALDRGRLRAHARRAGAGASQPARTHARPLDLRVRLRRRSRSRQAPANGRDRRTRRRPGDRHRRQSAQRKRRRPSSSTSLPASPAGAASASSAIAPKAIALALSDARADDVILIAGKGHETYQEVAGVKHDFDDLAVARGLLEQRA
jgi:UDP-N-acetylmuramoyl-L-alanyl-D-glutamate--2,6-diaminopimelate ligase